VANGSGTELPSFERAPEDIAKEIAAKRELDRQQKRPNVDVRGMHLESDAAQAKDPWPTPEPLFEPVEAEESYPLDALPTILSDAITEYRRYGQQPLSMVASSAIAAASLASQGLADVARNPHLVSPISLNFGIVAISGERKTSADRHFTRRIREWQNEKREALTADAGNARAALAAWEAQREGLLTKIKHASGKNRVGDQADIEAMMASLAELE